MCEVLDKSKLEEKEKKNGFLQKIGIVPKNEEPLSAERAWCESTYGESTYKKIEERIKDKQSHIRSVIRSKFAPAPSMNVVRYASYHCVIDIEEDLINYTEEIFKPFTEHGFEVINLSNECKKINAQGVFFISWRNAFKSKEK